MARIALLANAQPGIDVTRFLVSQKNDKIVALYVCNKDKECDRQIIRTSNLSKDKIFAAEVLGKEDHVEWLGQINIDVLIAVYWPYLLKESVFGQAKKTINFHPALLPVNRGWYPHVHSIIDGTPTGVTLHVIDKNADTGPIWVQKEVPLKIADTSKSIYLKLQNEIVKLFKENWIVIRDGLVEPKAQIENNATYHAKKEINDLDEISLAKKYSALDIINKLRARSFGDRGYAYFEFEGKRIYVNIRLSESCFMKEDADE